MSSSFQRRRDLYEPVVQRLREAPCEFDGFGVDGLHRLSAFDGALMSFEAETRQALQVLDELLASDEDMLGLLQGIRRRDIGVDPERHGVVELLLEAYRRLSAVAGDVAELRGKVQSATELGRDDRPEPEQHHQVRPGVESLLRSLREPSIRHRADAVAEPTSASMANWRPKFDSVRRFDLYLSMSDRRPRGDDVDRGNFWDEPRLWHRRTAPLAIAGGDGLSGLVGAAVVAGFHAAMRSQNPSTTRGTRPTTARR